MYSSFKDNILGVDLADMQSLSKYNKGIKYLLRAIDLFSKYAWIIPLKDKKGTSIANFFFSIWVFFHEHSRFTGQQGKGEGIYLTPLYHFHPRHRHLDISRVITVESSPLHIAGSRTRTGNLWFPSASR